MKAKLIGGLVPESVESGVTIYATETAGLVQARWPFCE
jgi:hypothetical protein